MFTGSEFLIRQYAYDLGRSNPCKEVKLLSERDLCKIYDVSRTTVRNALEELVAEGRLVIRQGVGTFTNPGMFHQFKTPGSNLTVGIIVGGGKDVLYMDYSWQIISAAGKAITKDFGSVRILQIVHDGEQAAKEIQLLNLDGIVWVHPSTERATLIRQLQDSGLPVVCVGHNSEDENVNNVVNDYFHIGYMAAEYLLARGHRNILFIISDEWSAQIRLKGFKQAFADKNLKYDEKLILDNPSEIIGDIQKMMRFGVGFTACFAFGACVWDVVSALKSKWGDDFAEKCEIVSNTSGCGETDLSCPIVEIDAEKLGKIAAEKLIELIAGRVYAPVRITLRPEMKNIAAINKTYIQAKRELQKNSLVDALN